MVGLFAKITINFYGQGSLANSVGQVVVTEEVPEIISWPLLRRWAADFQAVPNEWVMAKLGFERESCVAMSRFDSRAWTSVKAAAENERMRLMWACDIVVDWGTAKIEWLRGDGSPYDIRPYEADYVKSVISLRS